VRNLTDEENIASEIRSMQMRTGIAPAAPRRAMPKTDAAKAAHDHGKFHMWH